MNNKGRKYLKTIRLALGILFLAFAGCAFGVSAHCAFVLSRMQAGPVLMKCLSAFSAGTLIALLAIAMMTFLFGRFYCALLCPLGICQDIFSFLCFRKSKQAYNYAWLRYAICGIAVGMLAFGWHAVFLLFDPYSVFGRITGAFLAGGFVPLLVIAALSIWKKRVYCTSICPVGTLLGLLAKWSVFRLSIKERCVKCGKCALNCPSGCIDIQNGAIDNERCVRCMNCVSACPLGCIGFGLAKRQGEVPVNQSRRAFLINGGILLAGLAAGAALAKCGLGALEKAARRLKILPPGAGDANRFAAKCTGCQLCKANCPQHIIVSAPGGTGPVALDLSKGHCDYNCNRCSQVCPTGAILPLTLEAKRRTKIAEASFNAQNCIVFQEDEPCGECARNCPAKAITLRRNGTPKPVNTKLCIGCGACQEVCPAENKAMTVHEIEKQVLLEITEE